MTQQLPNANATRNTHYAIFGVGGTAFDIFLIRDAFDPHTWRFIGTHQTLDRARATVDSYMHMREIARSIGWRPNHVSN